MRIKIKQYLFLSSNFFKLHPDFDKVIQIQKKIKKQKIFFIKDKNGTFQKNFQRLKKFLKN